MTEADHDDGGKHADEREAEAEAEELGLPGFDELLTYLRGTRGFDFSGYKRGGLARRVGKRVRGLGITSFLGYVDYLQVHPDELSALFNSILINVTSFFRDTKAWDHLRSEVLPRLIAAKQPSSHIRVWSAGCATGQEAYSVAMALAEVVGCDELSERVKIYATDIDDGAVEEARQATYSSKAVESVPREMREKYFDQNAGNLTLRKPLRRSVIFGLHNLLTDAPISHIDLLLCRNTLMYFNAEAQARILSSLHFALSDSGVLFLGKAEMLLTHGALFSPLDLRRRLFNKAVPSFTRARLPLVGALTPREADAADGSDGFTRLREACYETSPLAQLAFDASGVLRVANENARRNLNVTLFDLGRGFEDLELSRQLPGLRALFEQTRIERRTTLLSDQEWRRIPDESRYLDVRSAPLLDDQDLLFGVQVTFLDVTGARRAQIELQTTSRALESMCAELQSTSEELETTVEELETTNEELRSSNDELQSTNEELEATNEELQSTNEELQSSNEELRGKSSELSQVSLHLGAILASLHSAVIMLDRELHVRVWSPRSEDLWGLRSDEARAQHFLNLDIGFPVEQLVAPIRACLARESDHRELTLSARNRRGRMFTCEVAITPLVTQEGDTHGVILLMDDDGSKKRKKEKVRP